VTEERAFRPVWSPTEQYLRITNDGTPEEIFYLGDSYTVGGAFGANYGYYQVNAAASVDPPIGTVPTNTTYWTPMTTVDSFIAYDQRDRRSIGAIIDIYSGNPRIPTGSMRSNRRFNPSEKGIDVVGGGVTVFITQKLPVPEYTITPYVTGKTYVRGDTVFDPNTGECFQAVGSTSSAPSNSAIWNWVPFLQQWENYVASGAFSDSLMESDTTGDTDIQQRMVKAQAADERATMYLQSEVDALTIQGERLQWNFRGHRRREVAVCASSCVMLTDV
jgi:hypothetical protein